MVFVACGLNHKTAPLAMREQFSCAPEDQPKLLSKLLQSSIAQEAALLSTCNRTEFYCDTTEPEALLPWLADEYKICTSELSPYLYIHPEQHGIRHTLRVASGLDSMMLGEPQILGQMKQAYQNACQAGTVKHHLRTIFEYIFSASKRIRSHSGIGKNPISVAYAGVRLISKMFDSLNDIQVFLIGSGETATLVAKYLQKEGASRFYVASRTEDNARQLASSFSGQALSIADIPHYLSQADVVVTATACPLPFINQSLVRDALEKRQQKPMFFLDLAVPRDIEPEVSEIENVQLFNVDDLEFIIKQGMNDRRTAAVEAEELINHELDHYLRWHRSLRARDMICDYRSKMKQLTENELNRAMKKLAQGHDSSLILEEFSERLFNKLTHQPSVGFRQSAWDGREDLLELGHYLFNTSNSRELITCLPEDTYEEIS